MKNRKLMRVGTPIGLRALRTMLEAVEASDDAIVRHQNGELIVEDPVQEMTLVTSDGDEGQLPEGAFGRTGTS